MHVYVIGTGYVGLVINVCLGCIKHQVTCVDNSKAKVALVQLRQSLCEPELSELMQFAI